MTETARPDTRDMLAIHQVFRRELPLAVRLVRECPEGDGERAAQLAAHVAVVTEFLHIHHHGEDELLWPALLAVAPEESELVARMAGDHDAMNAALVEVTRTMSEFASDAAPAHRDAAAAALDSLAAAALGHLDAEEAEVLPLCERVLTIEQWGALGEHGRSSMPQEHAFTIFGMVLEDLPPETQAFMLGEMPPPVVTAWEQVGRPQYEAYVAALRTP
jgi:hemerythrin-like domain-containing protein